MRCKKLEYLFINCLNIFNNYNKIVHFNLNCSTDNICVTSLLI